MEVHFQFQFFAIWSISACIVSIIAWKDPTSSWYPSELAMFFRKLIPGVLGRSVNFKIPKRCLCRRPVFLDYLSISCDYDEKHLDFIIGIEKEQTNLLKELKESEAISKIIYKNLNQKILDLGFYMVSEKLIKSILTNTHHLNLFFQQLKLPLTI